MGVGVGAGKPDPDILQSGSWAWTTVLCVSVCSSKWTGRSLLCGAADMGVPGPGSAPRGPFADSIGVRKLVELLQGGFDCVTGGNVAAVRLSDPWFFSSRKWDCGGLSSVSGRILRDMTSP